MALGLGKSQHTDLIFYFILQGCF